MSALIQHVREFGLESLEKFAIKTKRHKKWPNLISFNYNQIKSPFGNPVVKQARGIILDESNDWSIVSYPYDKFFNYGETHAETVDWETAVVYEKVDGSLMTLYYYEGEWVVASSGTPDASGPIKTFHSFHGGKRTVSTFAEEFWRIWNSLGYKLPEETHLCFMFELVSHYNRIVCLYEEEAILIHGCRNVKTTVEEDPIHYVLKYGWKPVRAVPLKSIDEVVETANNINGTREEGFVVRDNHFRRVKIKSPAYVKLSLLTPGSDEVNYKSLATIVQKNEGEEFLVYFPYFQSLFNQMKERYEQSVIELDEALEDSKGKENKELAKSLSKKPGWFSKAVFVIRKNGYQTNAREYLSTCSESLIQTVLRPTKGDLTV